MRRYAVIFLALSYGAAWSLASTDPAAGVILFALSGTIVSAPLIISKVLTSLAAKLVVAILGTLLSVLFPPAAFLVGGIVILLTIGKFGSLLEKGPLIAIGVCMYLSLIFVPSALGLPTILAESTLPWGATHWLLGMIAGPAVVWCALKVALSVGVGSREAAAFIFFLPALLVLLLLPFADVDVDFADLDVDPVDGDVY